MIWLDAHLSPRLAEWIRNSLGHEAIPLRDLGLRHALDEVIYQRGADEHVILITKDKDFADMVTQKGAPPQVIWLRCGNTTEARLREIFTKHLNQALKLLATGESLVEIQ